MCRVLIIDNDAICASVIGGIVEAAGHEPIVADGGAEGLHLYQQSSPDIVVTDILMPDVDGIEIVREIRNHSKDIPIIAVSAGGSMGSDFILRLAERCGVDIRLSKPFTPDEMFMAVDSACFMLSQASRRIS